MGYSLAWLALRGKPREIVLEKLGLSGTGEHEDFAESEMTCVELPGGWFLVVTNVDERVAKSPLLADLTLGAEAVECFVEEHVMVCTASAWKDGKVVWSVTHDSQTGNRHLETSGQLPEWFDSIKDELITEQAAADREKRGVDYIFEIPVVAAQRLTGFRHDEDVPGLEKGAFEILAKTAVHPEKATDKKSWWKFW